MVLKGCPSAWPPWRLLDHQFIQPIEDVNVKTNVSTHSIQLLGQVAQRLRLASFGKHFYLCVLIVSGIYTVTLLANRLLGLGPEGFDLPPATLLVIPALALLSSLLWHRRPTNIDAARVVDQSSGTKDLFLTFAMLEDCAGEYKPLVSQDAERRAPQVDPQAVVPWRWTQRVGRVAVVAVILLLCVLYLPQLDPFGKVAAAQAKQEEQAQLERDKKATELRLADLEKQGEVTKETQEIDRAINDMTSSFRKMKPREKQPNLKKLNEHQQDVGEKWRKMGSDKLRTLLSQAGSFQDFGGQRQQKLDRWSKELLQGSSKGLEKELAELQEQLKAMMEEMDPVKRSEMAKLLKQRLRDLDQFASENVGSPELSAALRRAMRQLETAEREGSTSTEALEALAKSLDLSKLELQQIAKSAQNMKALEEALEVLQMAKQLNEDEMLDGEAAANCQSLSDYAELYAQMMGEEGNGGMGGEGIGRGGEAPEDDSVASDFKTEQQKTAAQAGKILMSLKAKGMSDSGEAEKNYRQLLGTLKQSVGEAIAQEQIPPGYHEGIRGYFNTIGQQPSDATAEPK